MSYFLLLEMQECVIKSDKHEFDIICALRYWKDIFHNLKIHIAPQRPSAPPSLNMNAPKDVYIIMANNFDIEKNQYGKLVHTAGFLLLKEPITMLHFHLDQPAI
jgi:hypothetical protein